MEKTIQIKYNIFITILFISFFSGQEKWNYSAKQMNQIKGDGITTWELTDNVKFVKKDQLILTDNAIQHVEDGILYMNGNIIMIQGADTLTCDSMIYWSKLDSGYAMGNVLYIQPKDGRYLETDLFDYWKTNGYRGSSFIAQGSTKIVESDRIITANKINYNDEKQIMSLADNAFIRNNNRGILGDKITIQYLDSLINRIDVNEKASSYNDLKIKINKTSPYHAFRDEMSSKKMVVYFKQNNIDQLQLINMAQTYYHVINDSLLEGANTVSGDSIQIDFSNGEIDRIQVNGGALGDFRPERANSNVDTTIYYAAEHIDYQIQNKKSFLLKSASVEYQNTKLDAGKIIVDWETNILDAIKIDKEYPTVTAFGKEPMQGESMIFDMIKKHGRITKGKTSLDDSFYHGDEVFRDDPDIFHLQTSKYTSCELDHPHFYLGSKKMKMIPEDKVIAKPLLLYILDFPVFYFPMAIFPNSKSNRHSGWIMPSFESYESIGTGFRNLGYYWAPNNYMDAKTTMNFFDKKGLQTNYKIRYKKIDGKRAFNHNYNGSVTGTYEKHISTNEIMDLTNYDKTTDNFSFILNHNQVFDPNQSFHLYHEFISRKDVYQNAQEVDEEDRLRQNIGTSLDYRNNFNNGSFSIGYKLDRDLRIENSPSIEETLYQSSTGPNIALNIDVPSQIFGSGDSWNNSLYGNYSMYIGNGREAHYIKQDTTSDINEIITRHEYKTPSISHTSTIGMSTNILGAINIIPSISLSELWVWKYSYEEEFADTSLIIEKQGFRRRLTGSATIDLNTSIYGLFPIKIGKINAIRHVITPEISFSYTPDFSKSNFDYFQQDTKSGDLVDYFQDYSTTPKNEIRRYTLSLHNVFQIKIKEGKNKYIKPSLLFWNSSISYDEVADLLSDLNSTIRIKSVNGNDLFRINMAHNFYKSENNKKLVNIWKGELPRLTTFDITTDVGFKLIGSKFENFDHIKDIVNSEDLGVDSHNLQGGDNVNNIEQKYIWETNLGFSYTAKWEEINNTWDTSTFTLNTTTKINLSKNWMLTYSLNFNIEKNIITRNSIKVYRPLHCWEFSFNYWPRGLSSGFSLEIKVKNPKLQDIKVLSSDANRGFSSY